MARVARHPEAFSLQPTAVKAWAILWRSESRLDGRHEYLQGTPLHPCRKLLFDSRAQARAYINDKYGYIRTRPDLQAEPHGWRMPVAVRVNITVEAV